MPLQGLEAWCIPAAKLLDYTARTYVPVPSKLAATTTTNTTVD